MSSKNTNENGIVGKNPWIGLKPNDKEYTKKAYCSFINAFKWVNEENNAGYEDNLGSLIILFDNDNEEADDKYRYKKVPRSVYIEAHDRAVSPQDFDDNFGNWYSREIKDNYEHEKF